MRPVEEGSPVIGRIDVLRPVNGDRFLVSFSQLCRGLGRHVDCLLWHAVAASFLALARCWATDEEARSDRWRLGHRRRALICSISCELADGIQLSNPFRWCWA